MASLFFEERHSRYRVRFEFAGVAYNRSLGKPEDVERAARDVLGRVEETLRLLAECRLKMPEVADPLLSERQANARRRREGLARHPIRCYSCG